jgi:hypothetical protein
LFIAPLFARFRAWGSRASTTMVAPADVTPRPVPQPIVPVVVPERQRRLIDQIQVGRVALPVPSVQTVEAPRRRRPIKPRPTLATIRSSNPQQRLFCGRVAISALIGADVDQVISAIQERRGNSRLVRGTTDHELRHVCERFGYRLHLVSDLTSSWPTLAT